MIFKILFGIIWYLCVSLAVMIFMMVMTRKYEPENRFYADWETICFGIMWSITIPVSVLIICYEGFKSFLKKVEKIISQDL